MARIIICKKITDNIVISYVQGQVIKKMQNRSGTSTDLCGIPHSAMPSVEYCPFRKSTLFCLVDKMLKKTTSANSGDRQNVVN